MQEAQCVVPPSDGCADDQELTGLVKYLISNLGYPVGMGIDPPDYVAGLIINAIRKYPAQTIGSHSEVAKCPGCKNGVMIIDNKQFKIEIHSRSKAGMTVPRMSKAIKITHLPTGNVVICQHHRSQHKNKAKAIAALELML